MTTENARRSTRLNVEALEAREVPATFGATRGLSIAEADVIPFNGQTEFITATGPGRAGVVRVWTQNGTLLDAFNPFGGFTGGVVVAAGDVNNDGQNELICATAAGTTAQVKVYEYTGGGRQTLASFTPFGPLYSGGVQIAAGNVSGDRRQEIIVGQGTGGSMVKVYSFDTALSQVFQIRQFRAYAAGYGGGVSVASANIDTTMNSILNPYNFNYAEIITGMSEQLPLVRIWDAQSPTVRLRASYFAFDPSVPGTQQGIDVVAGDTDGIRGAEVYVALKNTGIVRFFAGQTGAILGQIRPFPATYSRTVNMAIANNDDDFFNIYSISSLAVVAGDGPYDQVPILYDGRLGSPAGLNGSHLAP